MTDDVGLERCRRDMESQLGMCRNKRLWIGSDWNADVEGGVGGIECVVILEWKV